MRCVGTGPFMTTPLRIVAVMTIAAGLVFSSSCQQATQNRDRFAETSVLLDSALSQFRETQGIPGISAAIIFPDNQVWRGIPRQFGIYAGLECVHVYPLNNLSNAFAQNNSCLRTAMSRNGRAIRILTVPQ